MLDVFSQHCIGKGTYGEQFCGHLQFFFAVLTRVYENELGSLRLRLGPLSITQLTQYHGLQMIECFLEAGASIAAIRMGSSGSLLASQESPRLLHTPAAEANIVDVTGCGNAFNGALLAALQRGCTLADAACWGSAAASFMAEAEGVPLEVMTP